MEINIENAFLFMIKLSLSPFLPSLNSFSQKVQKSSHDVLLRLLEKPLLSTILITCMLMIILSILTMSLIILATVFCITVVVFIFEGLIFGVILILAAAITVISMECFILLVGVKLSLSQ